MPSSLSSDVIGASEHIAKKEWTFQAPWLHMHRRRSRSRGDHRVHVGPSSAAEHTSSAAAEHTSSGAAEHISESQSCRSRSRGDSRVHVGLNSASEHTASSAAEQTSSGAAEHTSEHASESWSRGYNRACAYQLPWAHMRGSHQVQAVFHRLDQWLDGIAPTLDDFADQVHGATEHVQGSSRSDGHYLSTMARSITAMTRAKIEGDPHWKDAYGIPAACVRLLLMKTRRSDRKATIDNLHDFMRWRVTADVLAIMSEGFLANETYMRLSPSERKVALSSLLDIEEHVQAACTVCKIALRERARCGAAEHAR